MRTHLAIAVFTAVAGFSALAAPPRKNPPPKNWPRVSSGSGPHPWDQEDSDDSFRDQRVIDAEEAWFNAAMEANWDELADLDSDFEKSWNAGMRESPQPTSSSSSASSQTSSSSGIDTDTKDPNYSPPPGTPQAGPSGQPGPSGRPGSPVAGPSGLQPPATAEDRKEALRLAKRKCPEKELYYAEGSKCAKLIEVIPCFKFFISIT